MKRISIEFGLSFVLICSLLSCRLGFEGERDRLPEDLESISESLHNTFFQFNVLGGTETEDFRIENEGLHGIYGISTADTERTGGQVGLLACVQSSNLSMQQMARIRAATVGFTQCRNGNGREYQLAVRKVLHQLSQQRERLVTALQNGEMRPEEVRSRLHTLREIAKQQIMDEKVKHAQDLRLCLQSYVEDLNANMTAEQWAAFRSCILD